MISYTFISNIHTHLLFSERERERERERAFGQLSFSHGTVNNNAIIIYLFFSIVNVHVYFLNFFFSFIAEHYNII